MAKEPLDVLLRVRQMAVDQARQALSECLADETVVSSECNEIEAAIFRETDAAKALTADDEAVEAFAIWLHTTLPLQRAANGKLIAARARTDEVRTVLAAARAGVRAVEATLERRDAERSMAQARTEQRTLDEAGRVSTR